MENKKGHPDIEIALVKLSKVFYGNSAKDQYARFLQALNRFMINTDEANRFLGVYHQPTCASELRKHRLLINSIGENIADEIGVLRCVGSYVLRGGNSD